MDDPQKKQFARILMATTVLVAIAAMAGSARARSAPDAGPVHGSPAARGVVTGSVAASLRVDF